MVPIGIVYNIQGFRMDADLKVFRKIKLSVNMKRNLFGEFNIKPGSLVINDLFIINMFSFGNFQKNPESLKQIQFLYRADIQKGIVGNSFGCQEETPGEPPAN